MAKSKGLGRGLSALIQDDPAPAVTPLAATPEPEAIAPTTSRLELDPHLIRRNPWQPRGEMDAAKLEELAASIREHGILQPLLVRREGEIYELIAGERRLQAARLAELKTVPVNLVTATDLQSLEWALIENLQRDDLNAIEEAEGYRALCERFDLTQEEVAQRVGKGRPSVANALRLLTLPAVVRELVGTGQLSAGHAKVLLGVSDESAQLELARRCVTEGLSVRALERLSAPRRTPAARPRQRADDDLPAAQVRDLTERLQQHLGARIHLVPSRTLANGTRQVGRLEIQFHSNAELDRLLVALQMPDADA
ncbi:MAG: ParB/RepB/Spo0J family partition protein [Candidatus Marinimicrobia bacterium]|nr:ParB/RepB/Spo0J family partition protein [Candidatus Neomarinimicrobiota bacterium]